MEFPKVLKKEAIMEYHPWYRSWNPDWEKLQLCWSIWAETICNHKYPNTGPQNVRDSNDGEMERINMEQTWFPWAKSQCWDGVWNHLENPKFFKCVLYWLACRNFLNSVPSNIFDIVWPISDISVCAQGVELHRCGPPFWCGRLRFQGNHLGRKVLQRLVCQSDENDWLDR